MKTAIVILMMIALLGVTAMPAAAQENREQELYEEASEALDDAEWREAASAFRQVARMNGERAPAALHWLAYAQHKMGQRTDALATLVDLQRRYPKSKWAADGKALEVEIRQSAGQSVAPEGVEDEDLKLMVVNGLMHSDPERAIPILEKTINGKHSDRVKEKALFVLAQANTPRAMEILGRIARDGSRPELQAGALKNLGIVGGEASRKVLADVYAQTTDRKVKRTILKSYMISGDRARLLSLAKTERDPELRSDAVKQLGITGAKDELAELYKTETSIDVKEEIIKAMFLGGNAEKLSELARVEKVLELRLAAIKSLSLMGGATTSQTLVSMYESDSNREVKEQVIQGLFIQGNAKALVSLARKERNRELKREIVSKLSIMNSKEGADYLLEILNE
jgi:HEAT repeat protein